MNKGIMDVLLFLLLFLLSLRGDNVDYNLMISNEKIFAETGLLLFVIINAILCEKNEVDMCRSFN